MKVLMLGWEFPPFISGGLGTACYGLTRAMSKEGIEVIFVLPRPIEASLATHVQLLWPQSPHEYAYQLHGLEKVVFHTVASALQPYQGPEDYQKHLARLGESRRQLGAGGQGRTGGFIGPVAHYSGDMYREVHRYADMVRELAMRYAFDVIHAHDWMTYKAGIAAARATGRPLVVHVHSTEFDRSGEHVNQMIYDIEREGMHAADAVIAVSHLTKNICVGRYAVEPQKVHVVYNAVELNDAGVDWNRAGISRGEKIVLFLGRITMQKGPEYFLAAARKVLEVMDDVKFVMAGSGDQITRTIELAAQMGIGHKVLFTGFLRGPDVEKVYRMADLYVMPSVSEPFGIAPLEALSHDVPVLISKQSGVAEVLTHVLKVDFWDINEMANKIIAVLRHPPLQATLREHGHFEVRRLSWLDSARRCLQVYQQAIDSRAAVA